MAEAGAEEAPAPPEDLLPSPAPATSSSAGSWPDFAVVCSFLERYGAALDLPEITFPELEEALEETAAVSRVLVELHLKLMRKIGKSVTVDRWEKYLIKICQDYNSTWAWEMEKKGYQEMSVECKVGLLKHLCECQFDDNLKFKNAINEEDSDAMRVQPIGRDKDGLMYWYQLDQEHNVRVYIEEQDDLDASSWKCIVRSRNDLAEILELLKAQIDPALLKKPEENSSQNPNPDENDVKKEDSGEKPAEEVEMKEKTDEVTKQGSESSTKNDSNLKTDGDKPLKTSSEIKTEPLSDVEEGKPTAKEKDSFKENIKPVKTESKDEKAELKDLKELKVGSEKTPSTQDPERAEVSVIVKRTEEHVEKPVEDTEKMKNDQQAKIPLKKRELKLTDDFDSQVKAAICKSKTPTKELLQKEEGKLDDDGTKAAAPDGKQLVNGEVNSDKVHKAKVEPAEDGASAPRGSVIECAKDENSIAKEKRNSSVIKSLQELKENGTTKIVDGLEKSVVDLSRDRSTPPVPEIVDTTEADSNKSSAGPKVDDKKKLDATKEKPPQKEKEESKKDASHSESIKESEVVDEVPSAESKDGKEASEPAKQSVADEKVEEPKDDCSPESESKVKDVKNKATKVKLPVSKKSSTRNSAARKGKPSEDPEKPDNDVRKEPKSTEKADAEKKQPEAEKEKKTFPLRSKRKPAVRESEASEPKEAANEEAADKEKTSEKPSLIQKTKNKLKAITEEENSGSEDKEMTSERQKDGIKLTIRISNKRRRPELPVENVAGDDAEDAETEENIGMRLRRSPRISRPSLKVNEVKIRKPEKKQSDEEESLPPPAKPAKEEGEKKSEKDASQKMKKKSRPRRRTRWTNTRSRRKRKSSSEEETEESDSEEDSEEGSDEKEEGVPGEDDEPCKKCGLPNHPELILLCDSCDSGYHTACLRPPLMIIPDGEWFCPPCQHKLLCEKLEEQLQNLDVVLKKKERAERRKERLVYVGISIENIIPTQEAEEVPQIQEKEEKKKKKSKPLERRSTRTRKFISYRFDEFDEAIDEAIEDDIRDGDGGGGGGRGKDMSNITGHRGKDISTILEGEREEGKRPQRAVRRKKRRRLNDLDSDSNMDEEESEEEFRISDGSQEEFVVSENAEESDEDQQSNDSDFGARRPRRHYSRPMRQSRRIKRRSVRRRYSDDDEDDDDESEDDSPATETDNSSDYSEDYLDTRRRRSRRNQKRQVNYREDSDSENSQKGARHGRGKEMRRVLKRRFSSSESNVSDFSSDDEKPRNVKKNPLRKRIRSSNDELSDEEEERPVRKRLNRIETDDDDDDDDDEEEGDGKVCSSDKPPAEDKPPSANVVPEGTKKPCYRIESDDDDDFETVTKDGSPLDYSLVELPSANGQSPGKTIETLIGKPSEKSETTKDTSAPVSQASNGTGGGPEAAGAEEDEDELLRVTDLVDYVCNSEQL